MKSKTQRVVSVSALLLAAALSACSTGPDPAAGGSATSKDTGTCTNKASFSTLKDGVLQVAGMNEMPSYLGNTTSNTFEGFNAVMMQKFADENCLTLQWSPGTGPSTQLLAANGKVDAWVGIIIGSPERAKAMSLEETPLYYEFAGIASKAADAYSDIDQLKGKTVGMVAGSSYVTAMQAALGKDNIKLYQSSDEAYQDLANGRVNAVLTPSTPQGYWVSQHKDAGLVSKIVANNPAYPTITEEKTVVWPVNKSNAELTKALNDYFKKVNEDGTLKAEMAKFGVTDPQYFTGR